MKKIFQYGNGLLMGLFSVLFFATLLFAITSPNLVLGDNPKTGAGTTMVTTTGIIIVMAIVVTWLTSGHFKRWTQQVFVVHKKITVSILLAFTILWQISFVLNVHPPIGFDVGAIHEALHKPISPELTGYFSLNYNNLPLLLVQHFFATILHSTKWLTFDLLTLLWVDLSALMNVLSVWVIDARKVVAAVYIHIGWLIFFPMIIVSYSDTWVLPLVSGYFLCYCLMRKNEFPWWVRILAAIGFGVTASAAYFIKPSAIVGVIAIGLGEILFQFKKDPKESANSLENWGILVITILALGSSYLGFNHVVQNQNYVVYHKDRQIPAVHFISMGVSGDGGYNPKDALKMAEFKTKRQRAEYSKKVLFHRLKQKGVVGYTKFLVKKHRNNTADGTFAWVKEGHFINENPIPKGKGWAGQLRQFVYLYGKRLGDFRFWAQAWWVIWLILIAFGWRNQRRTNQVMRLTILGGFLYLLIFEGGRSRYLIQFLPAYLILASLVYDQSILFFKHVYYWANGIPKKDN